jgi:hypothetical protein
MYTKENQQRKNKMKNTFDNIASDLARLLTAKNDAYGNAFDKTTQILTLLYPKGIPLSSYKDVHVIIRMLDKLSRIAQNNDPFGESPYQDIAGYSLLALKSHLDTQEKTEVKKDE